MAKLTLNAKADRIRNAQCRISAGGYMAQLSPVNRNLVRLLGILLDALPKRVVADFHDHIFGTR